MNITSAQRFARHYIPEPNSGCWLWFGAGDNDGYGRFYLNGKRGLAHRASYEMFCGEIPEGLHVLHRCDNPSCVNPEHLFIGTHTDNMQDMTTKNRNVCRKGVHHHKAKLNPSKAFEIRWRAAMGQSWNLLAREFEVSKYLIQCIVHNRIWRLEAQD